MSLDGLINLHEYCLNKGIRGEKYHLAIETYLEALVEHKKIYGSAKHLLKMGDDSYDKAMEERKQYATKKAMGCLK